MSRDPTFVGIDVSKATLEVCEWPDGDVKTFDNHAEGVDDLLAWLAPRNVAVVAFEHTGWTTRTLADRLRDAEIPSVILDAKKVRRFATIIGREAKTDRLDARLIAQFAATLRPNVSAMPTQEERDLQDLARRVRQLGIIAAGEKGKLKQAYRGMTLESVGSHLAWLEAESGRLVAEIDRRIGQRPDWRRRSEIIQSMPCCGPILARTLITELPELGQIGPKRLASLVGIAPMPFESGPTSKRRRLRGGRHWVRRTLYMCSVVGTRNNPVLTRYYRRLVAAGKPPMSARAATMRKILIVLNAMVRDDRTWQPPPHGVPSNDGTEGS